jgi:RNA recognition motif-containing protein
VGNLPYDCTAQDVEELFRDRSAGPIARVHLPQGPDGRPRGFGFVTMPTAEAANGAIEALRDAELRGRRLMVNVAHPRGERPDRGGGEGRGSSESRGGGPSPPADRPERPPRPPREPSIRPPFPEAMDQPPPFMESPKSEGRRRGERPEKKPKKRKKGASGERGGAAAPKRGRDRMRDWEDWDED